MFKRWGLFILTNILVITTISIVLNILGVHSYITESGINYGALLVFCFVWGMTGSIISLLLSRQMAKWTMGVKVVDPRNPGQYRGLVDTIHNLAKRAGLSSMPEVGVYQSAEVNAFATGPSKSRSLVAVSEGLLHGMTADEIEGVLGHEIAHIQNGDMVTMTLIQGVVNAFTMFLSRVIAFAISQNVEERNRGMVYGITTFVLDLVIGFLGLAVVCWFSRQREYRADKGSARLAGTKQKMVGALERLEKLHGFADGRSALDSFKIAGKEGRVSPFATHPPIQQRIQALQTGAI